MKYFLFINILSGSKPRKEQIIVPNYSIMNEIPLIITISCIKSVVKGINVMKNSNYCIKSLKE